MADSSVDKVHFADYDILKYPIVSEKSTIMGASRQYFFVVDRRARKPEIKKAVERVFDVKVIAVNTLIRKGKNKTFRGHKAKRSDVKSARVVLAEGCSISSLIPGV
jgi:large subunit ribosomal protein L23